MPIGYDLCMPKKRRVRACITVLLLASCLAVSQSGVTSAWTATSPQVAVSIFGPGSLISGDGSLISSDSIAVDSSGNSYIAGFSQGSPQAFVSKLDASGNDVWAKIFGGSGADMASEVAVDSSGNVYTIGYFQRTVDFDPGVGTANLTSVASQDLFLLKLDASGNYVWAKQIGGTEATWGYSVTVDSSGNVYMTGKFGGTADFDPGDGVANLTSAGNYDVFVSKLNALGNFVWAKRFGGIDHDVGESVKVDSFGNVYTTGRFLRSEADFDPGAGTANLAPAGEWDVFVSKLDASGNYEWAKRFGGTADDMGYSVAVDSLGNVYTTGNFNGSADFDPNAGTANLSSAGFMDVFVSKLDASGNYVWAKRFGGTGDDYGYSVALDSLDNVLTTGHLGGLADFDPNAGTANLSSAGYGDVFVSKLDASGNYVWAKRFGGTSTDYGTSVAVDASNNVFTTGQFTGTVDFDPGDGVASLTVVGGHVFVSKLNALGNIVMPAPGAPTGVSATSAANAQSVVSWTAPASTGDAAITRYTVTSSPDGRTCAWTTGPLSCTVTGLTNGTSYTFSVTATSASGIGSASDASSSITPRTTPGTPTSVSATSAANAQSVVSWTAPASTGGATITGYTVTSSPDDRTCVWATGPLSCTVTGLTNGTSYTFSVTATNASGTGSPSDASSSITPSTTPSAPTSVSATIAVDEQSVVSWSAPASTGGATITGYTVTSSPDGRTCAWTTGPLSCTVTGLTNGTSYVFSVTATNVSGTGIASGASSSITPSRTPGAPTSVYATTAANAQSVVSWLPPASTGGATITGYTVTSIPGGHTCVWATGPLSCTVTGLTNGTSYIFRVTATNASGTGNASDASSTVIPVAPVATVAPTTAVAPVATVTPATATVPVRTLKTGKSLRVTMIASYAKLTIKTGSIPSLKVSSKSSRYCKAYGSILKGLKVGTCTVTVTVKPKTGRSASRSVTLKVTS